MSEIAAAGHARHYPSIRAICCGCHGRPHRVGTPSASSAFAPFGENGKLLFLFQVKAGQESRVYFDQQGNKIWQVVRQTGGADRLPQGSEVYQPNPLHNDPEKWFEGGGGC